MPPDVTSRCHILEHRRQLSHQHVHYFKTPVTTGIAVPDLYDAPKHTAAQASLLEFLNLGGKWR